MPKPLNGVSSQTLGDLPVEVEYSYHFGSPQTRDHPGDPDEVELISVRYAIDTEAGEIPLDCLSEECTARWIEKVEEEMADALAEGPDEDDIREHDYPEEL